MKCQNCGKEIDGSLFSPDLTYCPYCGQEMRAAGEAGRLQFCPYCGQKLLAQTNFCPHCGKKLLPAETKPAGEQTYKDLIEEKAKLVEEKAKTVAKAIRNTFGRERKIRKLYKQWAEFAELPPEEIPSMDTLKQMSAEEKAKKYSQPDDTDAD